MKRVLYMFALCITACNSHSQNNSVIKEYFFEIALGEEYGEGGQIRKWETEIRIFAFPQTPTTLLSYLDSLITELNDIIPDNALVIRRITTQNQANLWVYTGSAEQYLKIEPLAEPYLKNNRGLFYVYFDEANIIYKGSIFVDTTRHPITIQQHLLREELTQSLGLFNDSGLYPESIFYKGWSFTLTYSELDRKIIRILYNPAIRAGMRREEVEKLSIVEF